eukprot:6455799-Amphidinium_carterae.2
MKRKCVGYEPRDWEKAKPKQARAEHSFPWETEEGENEVQEQSGGSIASASVEKDGVEYDSAGMSGESEEEEEEDAGIKLRQLLLEAHMTGQVMSARLLTSIAYWANKAGINALAGLALPPPKDTDNRGEIGGHAKRKVDKFLNKLPKPAVVTYTVPLPSFLHQTRERGTYPLEIIPPHMALECIPDVQWEQLVERLHNVKNDLPRCYREHPLVLEHATELVMPWAIFLDGLQYSRKGSMLVVTLSPVAQDQPKLILGVLRKKLYCRCGCRGWCSLHALFQALNWSLEHLARGQHPLTDHLGNVFTTEPYKELAGSPLRARSIVTQIRIDWSECTSLALPNWRAADCPCLLCKERAEDWLDFSGLASLEDTVFDPLLPSDYLASCEECEIDLEDVTPKQWDDIKLLLQEDKKKQGARGLSLSKAYHPLGVKKGDRVEPTASQPDWAALFHSPPTRLHLWRRGSESFARHRNPLLASAVTHISMYNCYGIDWMHTLCLGVYGQFVAALLWRAGEAKLFQLREKDKEDLLVKTLERLEKTSLKPFYKAKRSATTLSQVDRLCAEMLGKREAPGLSAKASETLWLLHWVADATYGIKSWPGKIEPAWSEGAACLDGLWNLFQSQEFLIPTHVQQD